MASKEKTQRASLLLSHKLQQNLGKDPRIIILVPQKMGIFKFLNCISWLIIPTVQLYTGNCLLQLPGCCRSVVPLHPRDQSLNPKAVVKILLGVLKAASFHMCLMWQGWSSLLSSGQGDPWMAVLWCGAEGGAAMSDLGMEHIPCVHRDTGCGAREGQSTACCLRPAWFPSHRQQK